MSAHNHYDVIIIGTGAGGGTLAYKLASSGKRILLLERGGYVPREKDNFYRDFVGLKVVGTSENYGTEQEHLNNVPGARLRITTLRGMSGPGVELLEYVLPRDGRPRPANARATDILHWQTTIAVHRLGCVDKELRQANTALISSDVAIGNTGNAAIKRILVRDPDGHAIELVECIDAVQCHQSTPVTRAPSVVEAITP